MEKLIIFEIIIILILFNIRIGKPQDCSYINRLVGHPLNLEALYLKGRRWQKNILKPYL